MHTENYYQYFGFVKGDFVTCERCNERAVEIHHIKPRSFFGSKMKGIEKGMQDHIDNIMAVCRKCHDKAHDGSYEREELQIVHNGYLKKEKVCQ